MPRAAGHHLLYRCMKTKNLCKTERLIWSGNCSIYPKDKSRVYLSFMLYVVWCFFLTLSSTLYVDSMETYFILLHPCFMFCLYASLHLRVPTGLRLIIYVALFYYLFMTQLWNVYLVLSKISNAQRPWQINSVKVIHLLISLLINQ